MDEYEYVRGDDLARMIDLLILHGRVLATVEYLDDADTRYADPALIKRMLGGVPDDTEEADTEEADNGDTV